MIEQTLFQVSMEEYIVLYTHRPCFKNNIPQSVATYDNRCGASSQRLGPEENSGVENILKALKGRLLRFFEMDVSKNRGFCTPQIMNFNRGFPL